MALTERKVLRSVEVMPSMGLINVCWDNQVLRDEEVIHYTPHRCCYSKDQKEQFLAEVEGAEHYVAAVGW